MEIEDIYVGNGVSEMIMMAMQGLLNNGDEMLVPSPDYPLTAINLAGGKAVHYLTDESPIGIQTQRYRIKSHFKTKGIVVINPNNPKAVITKTFWLKSLN